MGRLNSSYFVGALALVTVLAPRFALAACGEVAASKGQVTILSAQTKRETPAPIGAKICSGDTITAGPDSRAKLKMEDGNELNVAPDSKIVLENYQFEPATNKKSVLLNVLRGKVRAATKQENMYNDKAQDGADNSFQVKTKTAVAGVRGTDFMTGYDPKSGQSQVVTFRGTVAFGAPGPGGQILNAVMVKVGQTSSVQAGQPPAPPKAVPPAQLQQMNSDSKGATTNGATNGGSNSSSSSSKASNGGNGSASGAATAPGAAGASDGGSASGSGSGSASSGSGNGGGPAPASVSSGSSMSGGGSMLSPADLAGSAGTTPGGNLVGLPTVLPPPPVAPPPGPPPPFVCTQCNAAIQTGNANQKANVVVTITLPH